MSVSYFLILLLPDLLSCIYVVFSFVFRLDHLFVNRYFVIHIYFQFFGLSFSFLGTLGAVRSPVSARSQFSCVCFLVHLLFTHGFNMAREFRRELNFSAV